MLHITIRQALLTDASALYRLQRLAMHRYSAAIKAANPCRSTSIRIDALSERLADVKQAIQEEVVFLAETSERELLGSLRLGLVEDLTCEDQVWQISRFVVHPEQQAKGIGKRLFHDATAWLGRVYEAEERAHVKLRLYTAMTNTSTVRFYKGLGFVLKSENETNGYPRGMFELDLDQYGFNSNPFAV